MQMLVRFSHRLNRQDANVEVVRAGLAKFIQHAFRDHRIDPDRQVRAVLLDRCRGQDGNHILGVDVGKFGRAVVGPVKAAGHAVILSV